jgi:hypothetical protein
LEEKTAIYIATYIALISKWIMVDPWDVEIDSEVQGGIKITNRHRKKYISP